MTSVAITPSYATSNVRPTSTHNCPSLNGRCCCSGREGKGFVRTDGPGLIASLARHLCVTDEAVCVPCVCLAGGDLLPSSICLSVTVLLLTSLERLPPPPASY